MVDFAKCQLGLETSIKEPQVCWVKPKEREKGVMQQYDRHPKFVDA